MRQYNGLTYQYNSRQAHTNFWDVGHTETGILGQSNTGSGFYPFTSADFVDPGSGRATDCPSTDLKGLDYRVYWNEASRFLYEAEVADLPGGGFSVLITDFDASLGDYHFYVSTVASQTTNTSIEPVTLEEAKEHLRVDFNEDDNKITRLITQCRRAIENYCCISIVSKQVTCLVDLFTATQLPYGPVVGDIVSFTDQDGNNIDPGAFRVDGDLFKRISPKIRTWCNARLVYNTGYAIVDEDLKLAILCEIAFRYENRGETTQNRMGVNPGVCYDATVLADAYKCEAWH